MKMRNCLTNLFNNQREKYHLCNANSKSNLINAKLVIFQIVSKKNLRKINSPRSKLQDGGYNRCHEPDLLLSFKFLLLYYVIELSHLFYHEL